MKAVNSRIEDFKKLAEETGFDESTIRGQTDEETVSKWLAIIRNWTDYQSIDQVPAQFRTPLIKEWFRRGWKDQIEREIRKMQRALPSG